MSSFITHTFFTGLPLTLGVDLAVFVLCWAIALLVGRFNVVDVVWGLSFVAIAVTSYGWTGGHGVPEWRRLLILAMVAVWGVRLSGYIGWRSRGKGEDPRYDDLLGQPSDGKSRALRALGIVFVLQAIISWVVSMPVQVAMAERSSVTALTWIGVAVWAIGLFFESVGDAQLAAFRGDPGNRGKVLDTGLWHYTRHPNYFGDATVWAGLWLVACGHWAGLLTAFSPVLMTWFLFFKTGKPLLEKSMSQRRPDYADYVRRTSGFLPLPPKRA